MEKAQEGGEKRKNHTEKLIKGTTARPVWDCDSSLYDSFELKSFQRQLESAIVSRTLSMPHFSGHPRGAALPPPPPQQQQQPPFYQPMSKKSSKISRSFQKLLRTIFRSKQSRNSSLFRFQDRSQEGFIVFYDRSGALTTIPEVPETSAEHGSLSPDIKSLVRRTASDRFNATSLGISCA